ncbi:uncharacterized protein [Rutidosis leptorrhynchoides]|uniref:uncharacterized protein n=1 Tax=Rutidosis leptorrhynchoides TaxID=125765 RepID=UPI003A99BD8F
MSAGWGFKGNSVGSRVFALEVVGNSGGLLLVWDTKSFLATNAFCNEFFLAVRGNWVGSGKESIIVNVYGPHDDGSKRVMWESLDNILIDDDSAWLLCGDFNEVRDHSHRLNCTLHHRRATRFNDFILRNNLIEIPINGRKFTRISDDGTKYSKLDRFLVSDKFISLWDDLLVIPHERKDSDHCPLILRDKLVDYGPKPFKVFFEWLNKDGVEDIIRDAWGKPIKSSRLDCRFRDHLKNVKSALRDWSRATFGNLDTEIKDLKLKVVEWEIRSESGNLNDVERATWLDVRRSWLEKEKVKLNMLRQNARIRWILEGDENSNFFSFGNKKAIQ